MTSKCTICDSPNAKACDQCYSTGYCSAECQQTDWPCHSLLCAQYSTHTDRPLPTSRRAILFPPNEVNPKFIWLDRGSRSASDQVQEHLGGKLGPYEAFPEFTVIERNVLRDRTLPNTLYVVCRDSFRNDGSSVNESVVRATHGASGHVWGGPILALKKQGVSTDPQLLMNIDMQDYRDVVDYFIWYGDETLQDGEVRQRGNIQGKVRGVKINCKGDQRTFGAEEFAAVNVPASHPVFYEPIAPISGLVGVPLCTRKCPPDKLWKDNDDEDNPYENAPATFLHLDTDESGGGGRWGSTPTEWQTGVGSVLAVRSDRQDVSAQQVEALCHFCRFRMQPLFESALGVGGGGAVRTSRTQVMASLTPLAFGRYFADMGRRMKDDDGEVKEGWTAGILVRGALFPFPPEN